MTDGTITPRFDIERGAVFGDDPPFSWSVFRALAVVIWPTPHDLM